MDQGDQDHSEWWQDKERAGNPWLPHNHASSSFNFNHILPFADITSICWFSCIILSFYTSTLSPTLYFLFFYLLCFLSLTHISFLQFYVDPVSGGEFRSTREVRRYLETMNSGKTEDGPSQVLEDHRKSVSSSHFEFFLYFWSSPLLLHYMTGC